MALTREVQDEVQLKARTAWEMNGSRGLLALATGTGKSKIPVDVIKDRVKDNKKYKVLIVVPTELLRDINWPEEFAKWKCAKICKNNVTLVCYASLADHTEKYDLIVGDEIHKLTESSYRYFTNTYKEDLSELPDIMMLTATPPGIGNQTDVLKKQLLDTLGPVVYTYGLDQGIEAGVVSNYQIHVLKFRLDNRVKYIPGGNKAKRFYQTEQEAYEYKDRQLKVAMYSKSQRINFMRIDRMQFIAGLQSKTEWARVILSKIKDGERTLLFGTRTEQVDDLLAGKTYHSKRDDKDFQDFRNGKISRLGVVNAVDEGLNIPSIDTIVMLQVNSNPRQCMQRIGRGVRFKLGHTVKVYILVAESTVDEQWLEKALVVFDKSKVKYHDIRLATKVSGITLKASVPAI
jgi:superfamily II DNA or RNA helicase